MTFLPPADVASVYALIALITDPEGAKARLDELSAEADRLREQVDAAGVISVQAAADREAAEKALDAVGDAQSRLTADRAAFDRDVGERTEMLDRRSQAITATEKSQSAMQADLADRERALSQREAETSALNDKARTDADAAASLRATLASKLAAVNAAAA